MRSIEPEVWLSVVCGVTIIGVALFLGRSARIQSSADRRLYADILLSPIFPTVLVWKLSLLITDPQVVWTNPQFLLFSSGSLINIIFGIFAGITYGAYSWWKNRPPAIVQRSIVWTLAIAAISLTALWGSLRILSNPTDRPILPAATFTDEKGNPWSLSDVSKPLVINVWASWCAPCRAEMPMLANLKDVNLITVNAVYTEKSTDAGKKWLEQAGISITTVYDYTGETASKWNIRALPTTIVLDADGRVVTQKSGAISRGWIQAQMRKARR